MEAILIPCPFITLVAQVLTLAQKTHFHASSQITILQLTSILIPMRYHLYLISTPTNLTETIPETIPETTPETILVP